MAPSDVDETQATGPLGKRSVFLLVCRSVYSSGGIGDEERALLKKLQKVFRLPPKIAKKLLSEAKRDAVPVEGEELSREEVFLRACEMAWADGELTDRERKILTALAATMKLEKADAERILRETWETVVGPTEPEAEPAEAAPTTTPAPSSAPEATSPVAGAEPPRHPEPPPSPPPTSPGYRPLFKGLLAGALVVAVAGLGGSIWWVRGKVDQVAKSRNLVDAVLPKQGPSTAADEALREAFGAHRKLDHREGLWGFGFGPDVKPTPSEDDARATLLRSETLRRLMVERFHRDLEPDGHGVVLQRVHDFRNHRQLHNRLAEDLLSLLVVGRVDEALALVEAKERHARLLGRGIANHPNLIARMIGLACSTTTDTAVAVALERDLVPLAARPRLAAVYKEALARDFPVTESLRAEFEMGRRAVRAFDEELGLLRYPMRLWWGDGLATVDELERRLDRGEPAPPSEFFEDVHVALQITIPNYRSANSRWKVAQATRRKLLESMG